MLSRYEQFSFAISNIYRSIQKIEREEMERYGLKGAYAQYLVTLERFPKGLTASQLCEICDLDKAAVSRAVSEMERRGLLERDAENATGYRAKLYLTSAGHEAANFVNQRAQQAVNAAGGDLTDDDRKVLYQALESISTRLQNISREGIPDKESKE